MKTIDINELEKIVMNKDRDEILMDVRTPAEFEAGHIPGFECHPLDTLENNLEKYRGKKIVVSCKSGGRAAQAVKILEKVADMRCYSGSFNEWETQHKPIIKVAGKKFHFPIDRQVYFLVGTVLVLGVLLGITFWVSLVIGLALIFSGLTGFCFLRMTLSKMPWNK